MTESEPQDSMLHEERRRICHFDNFFRNKGISESESVVASLPDDFVLGEPLEPPSKMHFIPLVNALTWIRFEHSIDIDQLLELVGSGDECTEEAMRIELEYSWCELADASAEGKIEIRGRRSNGIISELHEIKLTVEDLRSCRHLGWSRAAGDKWISRVERHPQTLKGHFDRAGDRSMSDFSHIVLSRHELLRLHPRTKWSDVPAKRRIEKLNAAKNWLEEYLRGKVPRSIERAYLEETMHVDYEIPKGEAKAIRLEYYREHPEWGARGRPTGSRNRK